MKSILVMLGKLKNIDYVRDFVYFLFFLDFLIDFFIFFSSVRDLQILNRRYGSPFKILDLHVTGSPHNQLVKLNILTIIFRFTIGMKN